MYRVNYFQCRSFTTYLAQQIRFVLSMISRYVNFRRAMLYWEPALYMSTQYFFLHSCVDLYLQSTKFSKTFCDTTIQHVKTHKLYGSIEHWDTTCHTYSIRSSSIKSPHYAQSLQLRKKNQYIGMTRWDNTNYTHYLSKGRGWGPQAYI